MKKSEKFRERKAQKAAHRSAGLRRAVELAAQPPSLRLVQTNPGLAAMAALQLFAVRESRRG